MANNAGLRFGASLILGFAVVVTTLKAQASQPAADRVTATPKTTRNLRCTPSCGPKLFEQRYVSRIPTHADTTMPTTKFRLRWSRGNFEIISFSPRAVSLVSLAAQSLSLNPDCFRRLYAWHIASIIGPPSCFFAIFRGLDFLAALFADFFGALATNHPNLQHVLFCQRAFSSLQVSASCPREVAPVAEDCSRDWYRTSIFAQSALCSRAVANPPPVRQQSPWHRPHGRSHR